MSEIALGPVWTGEDGNTYQLCAQQEAHMEGMTVPLVAKCLSIGDAPDPDATPDQPGISPGAAGDTPTQPVGGNPSAA